MFATSRGERAVLIAAAALFLLVSCLGLFSRVRIAGWMGEEIVVAAAAEPVAANPPGQASIDPSSSSDGAAFRELGVEGGASADPTLSRIGEPAAAYRIDLNTATLQQLVELPGIGLQLAARIIEYRESRGRFESVYELLNVKGIGEARFRRLLPLVTVSPAHDGQ